MAGLLKGQLIKWKGDRGFGFIQSANVLKGCCGVLLRQWLAS
jgi:hypothetical protein